MNRVLPEVWPLRDVDDVEKLCRGVLAEMAGRTGHGGQGERSRLSGPRPGNFTTLEHADYYESLGFLLGQVVIEERRFVDRGLDSKEGYEFRPWLYVQLRSRLIDFWRSFWGRHGQHRVPGADELAGLVDDGDEGHDRLDSAAAGAAEDALEARLATCGGLLTPGDREEAQPAAVGDRRPGERARRGAAEGLGRARAAAASAGGGASPAYRDCMSCGWRSYRQAPNGMPGWHWPDRCAACGEPLHAEDQAEVAA